MFPSAGNRLRYRDQYKVASSHLPYKSYKAQPPRGSSTRVMPMYSNAGDYNKRLQPLTTAAAPSPTIVVKPVLNRKPGAILTPVPLIGNPATYSKLTTRPKEPINANNNLQYSFEKPSSYVCTRI